MCGLTFALTVACCQDVFPGTEPPSLHHLYLLHPAFPSILLDLANATGTVTASEGKSRGRWGTVYTEEGRGCADRGEGDSVVPPRGGCVPADDGRTRVPSCSHAFPLVALVPGPSPESALWGQHPAHGVRTPSLQTCWKLWGSVVPSPRAHGANVSAGVCSASAIHQALCPGLAIQIRRVSRPCRSLGPGIHCKG